MNEHHPSGDTTSTVPGADSYGYGTGSYDYSGYATDTYATGYDTGGQDAAYFTTQQWDSGAQQAYAGHDTSYDSGYTTGYDSGSYDTSGLWTSGGIPQQAGPEQSWDSGGWQAAQAVQTTAYDAGYDSSYATPAADWDTGSHGTVTYGYGQTEYGTAGYDTAAYDSSTYDTSAYDSPTYDTSAYDTSAYEAPAYEPAPDHGGYDSAEEAADAPGEDRSEPAPERDDRPAADVVTIPRTGVRPRNRRSPKRSALLAVAAPSICVVGVAGVAAASVGDPAADEGRSVAAPDPASVKPTAANAVLDTQLTGATEDAGDFADRASRTQERLDIKERQEAEKRRKAEEAARKEALRPKFMLPVKQHGLSAYYGQAGVNWMSLHTGIDFPVKYGTPVMAATDGTVTTKWDYAYGNMVIVTAPDGTETWYCHLSSARILSGTVKAGDVIAYSGNSGNSTGPHLHFEVHPGGGDAIDPLAWLRSKGLNPL
ncbi:peptidoglycan DD-metalloendopeptidase family protein [Streptomyces sp. NPDC051940]|uniref:M23 family metallopeptidase n=1 Tax=Streptomyces sp. NPDC051940 TaxID=3155675 RepID=UPI0034157BDA